MKLSEIQELMHSFDTSACTKLELKDKDFCFTLEKATQVVNPQINTVVEQAPQVAVETPVQVEEVQEEHGIWIKAPLVGTFYAARSSDSKPFIEINQKVKKGDVLCIIEAMKVMNEIHAPCDGVVKSILVTNASMVEFDQNLIRIGEES